MSQVGTYFHRWDACGSPYRTCTFACLFTSASEPAARQHAIEELENAILSSIREDPQQEESMANYLLRRLQLGGNLAHSCTDLSTQYSFTIQMVNNEQRAFCRLYTRAKKP
jgi:hypothetical protein